MTYEDYLAQKAKISQNIDSIFDEAREEMKSLSPESQAEMEEFLALCESICK